MRCLIIDDEPLVRRSLVRAIQFRGHDAFEAVDGTEGLSLWQTHRPDVVFVDVLMPGLSGPDVVRRARAIADVGGPSAVILMSAFSGEDSNKLALECGADRFIAKPFDDIFAVVDLAIACFNGRTKRGI